MKPVLEPRSDLDTVIVPIVSLECMPRMTLVQRAALISELDEI